MDQLDKKIMYELDLNARISANQLAKKLKRNKETVNFRINRLIKNNYIKGFYTFINNSKLGIYYYKIYIKFKNITPLKEEELFKYIKSQNNVIYLGEVEGYFDCIITFNIKLMKDIINFMEPFMDKFGEFIQEKKIHTILSIHRFNQKFLHKGEKRKDLCYNVNLEDYKLDETDNKILNIISENARMSLIEIAKLIKVDHKVIKYRLNKLEKNKIILGYVTSPNFEKLNLQFIQINISLKRLSPINSIIHYFDSTNTCLFAVKLLGEYDLSIELHIKNIKELKKILNVFRNKYVNEYNDYDVSTIDKEHKIRFFKR